MINPSPPMVSETGAQLIGHQTDAITLVTNNVSSSYYTVPGGSKGHTVNTENMDHVSIKTVFPGIGILIKISIKTVFPGIGILIKIRQPRNCRIFTMGIFILVVVRWNLYNETTSNLPQWFDDIQHYNIYHITIIYEILSFSGPFCTSHKMSIAHLN